MLAHLCDRSVYWGLEQVRWLTRVPFPEAFMEVLGNNVSSNAGEGDRTLSPLLETKVELVVFHPLNSADAFLQAVSFHLNFVTGSTHRASLSAKMVCNSFGYGRLFCDAQHSSSHSLPWDLRSMEHRMQSRAAKNGQSCEDASNHKSAPEKAHGRCIPANDVGPPNSWKQTTTRYS